MVEVYHFFSLFYNFFQKSGFIWFQVCSSDYNLESSHHRRNPNAVIVYQFKFIQTSLTLVLTFYDGDAIASHATT